jgi:hypothetical protein
MTSSCLFAQPEAPAQINPASILLFITMNYLAVRLKAGERWSYRPPAGHTVLWTAVGRLGVAYMYTGAWVPNWPGETAKKEFHVGLHIMVVTPHP